MPEFSYASDFDFPVELLFGWHERPGAFERLNPPFMPVKVVESDQSITDGARVALKVPDARAGLAWHLEHFDYRRNEQFADRQVKGPFKFWEHIHDFTRESERESKLEERLSYRFPLARLLTPVADPFFRSKLEDLFDFRHTRTRNDLSLHRKYGNRESLRFLIAGSSGMLGRALTAFLTTGGHHVTRLVRSKTGDQPVWSPARGQLDPGSVEGYDVIINLAGENIGSGFWTKKKKQRILESRVSTTRLLADTIGRLSEPPRVFITASATGYYGDQGDQPLDEQAVPKTGFLNEVVEAWEDASRIAAEKETRTVNMRFGVILSGRHDLLARVRPVFLAGIGAVIGDGKNYFPWVAVDDAIAAIYHAVFTESLSGPVNVTAPEQITSGYLFQVLGKVLKRPVFLKIPAPLIKGTLGDMGRELFLASTRVIPTKLQQTGFDFQFPEIESTLRFYLGRRQHRGSR